MNKYIIIPLLFIGAMAGAAIIPLKYHFTGKFVPPLSEYHSYQQILSEVLPEAVKAFAEKFGCKDYILPVRKIEGDWVDLPALIYDVNLALQTWDGWKLSVDDELKKKMIQRADERFKTWDTMGVGGEMIRLLNTQKDVAMRTRYSAQARCLKMNSGPGDDVKLVLSVSDERLQAKLFEVPVTFIDPSTLAAFKKARKAKIETIDRLRRKAQVSMYILSGLSVLFLSYLLAIAIHGLALKQKGKKYRNFLCIEIDKREALIRDGHFVTALDLADRFLSEFPHDTEIKAFRIRLLDYTNQEPKRAQQAYVEWKKLQSKMKNSSEQEAILLTDDEKKRISGLISYHPELKASYTRLVAAGDAAKKVDYEKAIVKLEKVYELLKEGRVADAVGSLKEIRHDVPDFSKAQELYQRINRPEPGCLVISNMRTGAVVEIYLRQRIVFGRMDQAQGLDVIFEDRRVSRQHLAITYGTGCFTLEDLGSSGGTFVNGDAVTTHRFSEGDLINLSKVIDFDVSVYKNGNGIESGLLLQGKERSLVLVGSEIAFDVSGTRFRCPGTMIQVLSNNGVAILLTKTETLIPLNGDKIRIDGDEYKVEVR